MRDDNYSFNMFAAGCFAAGVSLCIVAMIIAAGVKNSIGDISEDIARCKSLQGEYGGGKCFKDGREI